MTTLIQRLHRAHPYLAEIPRSTIRHNRRQWLRSVRYLGDHWVVLQHVERKAE